MRAILIFFIFSVIAILQAQATVGDSNNDCEKIIDDGSSSYAPTRARLYMATPLEDDSHLPPVWSFGDDILDFFFPIKVRGAFDSVEMTQKNELLGVKGNQKIVIGTVSEDVGTAAGDMYFPMAERKITLNDDVKVKFQLIGRQGDRFWVAIFEAPKDVQIIQLAKQKIENDIRVANQNLQVADKESIGEIVAFINGLRQALSHIVAQDIQIHNLKELREKFVGMIRDADQQLQAEVDEKSARSKMLLAFIRGVRSASTALTVSQLELE